MLTNGDAVACMEVLVWSSVLDMIYTISHDNKSISHNKSRKA